MNIDRHSFIVGMTTAFAECVSRENKRAALSPPFAPGDLPFVREEDERIIKENGVSCWLDENRDLPEKDRAYWYVIYKFPESLEAYRILRDAGFNAALHVSEFYGFLGYGRAWADGYDALTPAFREERQTVDTTGRVLFPDGGWPIRR